MFKRSQNDTLYTALSAYWCDWSDHWLTDSLISGECETQIARITWVLSRERSTDSCKKITPSAWFSAHTGLRLNQIHLSSPRKSPPFEDFIISAVANMKVNHVYFCEVPHQHATPTVCTYGISEGPWDGTRCHISTFISALNLWLLK